MWHACNGEKRIKGVFSMLIDETGKKVNVRKPSATLKPKKLQRIKDFLQGSVFCFCNNNRSKENGKETDWFAARHFVGKGSNQDDGNYYWDGTPLAKLHQWHKKNGSKNPVKTAGQDIGHILAGVLADDVRTFLSQKGPRSKEYKWIVIEEANLVEKVK